MVSLTMKETGMGEPQAKGSLTYSEISSASLSFASQENYGCETFRRGMLPSRQSLIEYNGYRFLITDSPSEAELPSYMETLKKHSVKHVVRVCEPLYDSSEIIANGFKLHDWFFEDGGMPTKKIVSSWLDLIDIVFDPSREGFSPKETVAIHCRAGLGRAPVLVCLALIELGMEPVAAISLIRIKRRGAINSRQLQELISHQPRDREIKQESKNSKRLFTGRSKIFSRRRSSKNKHELAGHPLTSEIF